MGELTLNKSNIELELEEGKTVIDEIIATKRYLSKPITWTSSNTSVATVNASEETRATVTAVTTGETTITATCNVGGEEYTQTCKVTVIKPPSKGDFVEYNVAYTDTYKSYKYTSTNGWRLLDYTNNGDGTLSNVKLISTGIPAKLYYQNTSLTKNGWVVSDTTKLDEFIAILNKDGEYPCSSNGVYDKYCLGTAAGLYYNFEKIPFVYSLDDKTASRGFFTEIIPNGTKYNSSNATTAILGGTLFNIYGEDKATVREITLPELNKALGRSVTSVDDISAQEDPKGLYVLQQLQYVDGMKDYVYDNGYMFFASQKSGSYLPFVRANGTFGRTLADRSGLRPMICLSNNVKLIDTNADGVLEIEFTD